VKSTQTRQCPPRYRGVRCSPQQETWGDEVAEAWSPGTWRSLSALSSQATFGSTRWCACTIDIPRHTPAKRQTHLYSLQEEIPRVWGRGCRGKAELPTRLKSAGPAEKWSRVSLRHYWLRPRLPSPLHYSSLAAQGAHTWTPHRCLLVDTTLGRCGGHQNHHWGPPPSRIENWGRSSMSHPKSSLILFSSSLIGCKFETIFSLINSFLLKVSTLELLRIDKLITEL